MVKLDQRLELAVTARWNIKNILNIDQVFWQNDPHRLVIDVVTHKSYQRNLVRLATMRLRPRCLVKTGLKNKTFMLVDFLLDCCEPDSTVFRIAGHKSWRGLYELYNRQKASTDVPRTEVKTNETSHLEWNYSSPFQYEPITARIKDIPARGIFAPVRLTDATWPTHTTFIL